MKCKHIFRWVPALGEHRCLSCGVERPLGIRKGEAKNVLKRIADQDKREHRRVRRARAKV